ncbi:MAG: hypothetical protein ACT4PP_04885 [Sporichthyaceae bacterium]
MRTQTTRSIAAAAAAVLLLGGALAACGDDDEAVDAAPPAASGDAPADAPAAALVAKGTGDPFVDAEQAASHMPMTAAALAGGISKAVELKGDSASPAADLRASLTHILTEHVYLAGIAVATAYHAGADSPEFALAAKTLDTNSVKVADAIGSVAPDERDGFLKRWQSHVSDFVDYAVGAKTGGPEGKSLKDAAVKNLTAYAKSSGAFFEKISGGTLPAKDIEKSFNEHIGLLAKAVDGFAAGDTKAYDQLKEAAGHMPMMAQALAGGVAKATKMDSDPDDAASGLRAGLTYLLTEHVYAAGVAVFTAYTAGADSKAFAAAAGTVDQNSKDLAAAIESLAGKEQAKAFLGPWQAHVQDFVDYAVGVATQDKAKMEAALANLDAYRTASGKFFNSLTGGLIPVEAVADELKVHIESTAGAIDSLAAALVKA